MVLRKRFVILWLLLLVARVSGGQTPARPDSTQDGRSGNWSARSSTGRTLMGSWKAVPGPTPGTVTGTWSIADSRGKPVATGAWAASKATTGWNGNWRAVVAGRDGEHSGSWTSSAALDPAASFADLFEQAVDTIVSGTWRAGSRTGAWSIRSAKREGGS
jgi:hypothetical protein